MDFKLVILVLFAYFIRPQDWIPGMSGINIMQPLMAATILTMLARKRGFTPGSLFKTPMDWVMTAYGAYIVLAAPAGQRPLASVVILLAYYFVTSQALSTPRRLTIYLRCWLVALVVVAAMALGSEYGIDLTGARDLTHAIPDNPRLVLNTYLFNNPNSLGHSMVIGIPLAYFVLFWRKPLRSKLLAVGTVLICGYCVYLTKSKGAYIIGFAVLVISQIFGRHLLFQAITVLLAITLGVQALSMLPRMTDMERVREDEAIMGRMLAWEEARHASKESPYGKGFKNFQAMIEFEEEELFKATHSSYVLVGAELGRYGMFFYLAVLYASLRILFTSRCQRPEDEVSRRAMFVLLIAYLGSNWLIDRSYHIEYFLLAGAVSAFHRRLGVEAGIVDATGEIPDEEPWGGQLDDGAPIPESSRSGDERKPPEFAGPALAYQSAPGDTDTIKEPGDVDTSAVAAAAKEEELVRFFYWRRLTVIDLLLVALFTKIVFDVWDYLLRIYFI